MKIFSPIRNTYREYPQPFWVLMLGTFIDRFGFNLILPYLGIYMAQRFNAPLTQVGAIFAIFAVSGIVGNFIAGAIADRFGRRLTLSLGMACAATARLGMGLAPDFTLLSIAAAFAGLFGALGGPAQTAMTADLLGKEKRADGFGIQRVVVNATAATGPLVGGLLLPVAGYLTLFALDALTSYVVAFIVFAQLPETLPQKANRTPESFVQTLAGYRRALKDGIFMLFVLFSGLTITVVLQLNNTLPLYLVKFQHLPESFYGTLLGVNALMVVFLQFPLTRRTAHYPLLLVMIVGSVLYLVGYGSYGLFPSVPVFILGMILITTGEMLVVPTNQTMITLLAPDDMRARYVATGRISWIIAQSVGPIAGGAIMDRFDANWVWGLSVIFCALSIAGYYGLYLYAGKQLNAKQQETIPAPIPARPTRSAKNAS